LLHLPLVLFLVRAEGWLVGGVAVSGGWFAWVAGGVCNWMFFSGIWFVFSYLFVSFMIKDWVVIDFWPL
jgi:hypothetical protein